VYMNNVSTWSAQCTCDMAEGNISGTITSITRQWYTRIEQVMLFTQ